jgi:hypothetical protein
MPRPDTGNFNRFLTSMGLVLLVAALVIPYFFFQNTDTLRIPARDLDALTATGREVLAGRQDAIAALEPWVLGFSGALAAVGVGLLVVGGRRLRLAQVSEEEEDELRKSRARAEIRRLSPEQLEDKRDEIARVAVEERAKEPQPKPTASARSEAVSPTISRPRPARSAVNEGDRRYRERRVAIERIEEKLLSAFSADELDSHSFLSNIVVGPLGPQNPIEVDGLFQAKDEKAYKDVLLEIRLWSESAGRAVRTSSESLLAAVARYQAVMDRRAVGWLLMVVPEDAETAQGLHLLEKKLTQWITPAGIATVLPEDQLQRAPRWFEDRLAADLAAVA